MCLFSFSFISDPFEIILTPSQNWNTKELVEITVTGCTEILYKTFQVCLIIAIVCVLFIILNLKNIKQINAIIVCYSSMGK